MKASFVWLLFLCLATSKLSAAPDDLARSFPDLQAFPLSEGRIHIYAPKNAKLLVKKNSTPSDEIPVPAVETMFDESTLCRIAFSWGASDDPYFVILAKDKAGAWNQIGEVSGTTIVVPGNGFVYGAGHSNTMFDLRRKYHLVSGAWLEVVQPFYRVDVHTKTTKLIELTSEPDGGEVIARVDKGSPVHVLVNRGNDYLISTPFGLTGWFKMQEVLRDQTALEDLWYAGD